MEEVWLRDIPKETSNTRILRLSRQACSICCLEILGGKASYDTLEGGNGNRPILSEMMLQPIEPKGIPDQGCVQEAAFGVRMALSHILSH